MVREVWLVSKGGRGFEEGRGARRGEAARRRGEVGLGVEEVRRGEVYKRKGVETGGDEKERTAFFFSFSLEKSEF